MLALHSDVLLLPVIHAEADSHVSLGKNALWKPPTGESEEKNLYMKLFLRYSSRASDSDSDQAEVLPESSSS